MWKRTSKGRFGGSRAISKARAFRTFGRKKLNWVSCQNLVCEPLSGNMPACSDGQPPDPVAVPLLTNGLIAGGYNYAQGDSDSVICRRLRGKLMFFFYPPTVTDSSGSLLFRAGLKLAEGSFADGDVPLYNPLQGDEDNGDYQDARWIRLYEKMVPPRNEVTNLPPPVVWRPFFSTCATRTETAVGSWISSGTGTGGAQPACTGQPLEGFNLDGECYTCEELLQTTTTQTNAAPAFVLNIDVRRPIRLRENQNLMLYFGAVMPSFTPLDLDWGCYGGIRALLEV